MDTWILVADGSRGRLFSSPTQGKPWKLVQEFSHPASRAKNRDIDPKEHGRAQQSFGAGHRPAMEPRTDAKEVEIEHFAHELAHAVSDGVERRACDSVALVAPPHFLGHLKGMLDTQAQKCLVATIDKDYTMSDLRELMERLDDAVHPN
ncbi:MAG TPA: host attachment protein [Pirellulales bacterium]